MAVTKIHKTSKMVLYAIMGITVLILAVFLLGGEVPVEERVVPTISEPRFTDLLMYWVYALLAISVLVLIAFAVSDFISSWKARPKSAFRSLLVVLVFVAMLIITFAIGSGTPLNIVGYTGSENVPIFLKITDMWLYSIYLMVVVNVLALLFSPLLKSGKK
ncbi:hypothetical protein [Anaerorudis cellulosivorans]|uniref:hypothetical protein n=1 Tax=Anaerorudis cellulosivorans TaxID=3397862 RepID=UPI00221E5E4A|nr:hypothetical protein [Seramator thermalis]MCW1735598.1 hypothetical protein [Seramator thermalis]